MSVKGSGARAQELVIRPVADMGDANGVIARWPKGLCLLALVSRGAGARWTVLATPTGESTDFARAAHAGEALRTLNARSAPPGDAGGPPFAGGWIGWLGYDLGVDFEPTARNARKPAPERGGRGWLARCDAALVRDESTGAWFATGADEGAVNALLAKVAQGSPSAGDAGPCEVGAFASVQGRAHYERAVARTVEYVHAGDVFQANIAHELVAPFAGSARGAFLRMLDAASPAFGALLEPPADVLDRRVVCSISPELFLDADFAGRTVRTRPIKGTRGGDSGGGGQERELRESGKDAAELAMIVDLMRNDLSRVCEPGTVRVDEERVIERHGGGGVLHAVAGVSGVMRTGTAFADLLGATFPPGSVTGAPKIRAMQIIDELEPFTRGAYCGAIGMVSDHGLARLSVAIRTASIDRDAGRIVYPVGAGIVAESDPAQEWRETLTKAEAIARAFGAGLEPE